MQIRTVEAGTFLHQPVLQLEMSVISDSVRGCEVKKHVTVVGGGLVGPLLAVMLGRRGFDVHLYESRPDIRKEKVVSGRSINMTLSNRGIEALRSVGLEDEVLEKTLPVQGRKIHPIKGKMYSMPYGMKADQQHSVDRHQLNELLLTKAEEDPNVSVHFEHRLLKADLKRKLLTFDTNGTKTVVETGFIFGCDGAYSTVRQEMMRVRRGRVNYQQQYIDHGYKELTIPATPDGEFAMEPNFLHIWPRGDFMMIALPNPNKTFTLTLFMPFTVFESIKTEEKLLEFFTEHFPDTIEKIGVQQLGKDYNKDRDPEKLFSVKCSPHYMAESTLILGDAAHAVVPFFGQGVNAGFEDCLIFSELLTQNADNILVSAKAYQDTHLEDTHAICDLSMNNYRELRSLVLSRSFLFWKRIDNILHRIFPSYFPLHSMVAFSRIPYHQVVQRNAMQQTRVRRALWLTSVTSLGVLGYLAFKSSGMKASLHYQKSSPACYAVSFKIMCYKGFVRIKKFMRK